MTPTFLGTGPLQAKIVFVQLRKESRKFITRMQKLRVNDAQVLHLASKARQQKSSGIQGFLWKRSPDSGRWQPRYFVLYQNLLFHYENERAERPIALTMLESCRVERIKNVADRRNSQSELVFSLTYKSDGQRCLDLRADTESDLHNWMAGIEISSFSQVLQDKNELEQRHLHLLHVLDSERQAKWQYVQQTELLASEVKHLKNEVLLLKDSQVKKKLQKGQAEETEEIRKIKKVQSFIRGWMCRRRWKQIVAEYINSEHAESMRKRNSVVFGLVEWEKEYVSFMSKLATCFLRPFRMMASAKKPIISHEDVNSIFLNAETVLFLHQIFLQGLNSKIDNWPTLQLGDIFDILLPMLGIYHEYVRNHHYSLQVLAEYKQKPEFAKMLHRCEEKPACDERSLETFLTYPMYQIPHYIRTLTELLAHTPHDHVDRKQLEYAKRKLEELSHVMHDEVSETENIRKNLAIERMIIEGCNVLLDVNQIFVRQGSLIQTTNDKPRQTTKSKLSSIGSTFKESKKEAVRQCFLFTNHLLITTRASSGRLHLLKNIGEVALAECTLIEDTQSPTDFPFVTEDDNANQEVSMLVPDLSKPLDRGDYNGLDFRIIITPKDGSSTSITLVASTPEEKNAWCTDLNQCIEQNRFAELLTSSISDSSSVALPHTIRSDPSLYRDDVDIKLSRTLNSCKIPQIRHASVPRLLIRLTDIRFLSIDYLNTFLMMYPVFTDVTAVMQSFRRVLTDPDGKACNEKSEDSAKPSSLEIDNHQPLVHHRHVRSGKHRRISTGTVPGDVRRRSVEAEDDQMSLMSEIIESHWSSEEDFMIATARDPITSVNIDGCTIGESTTENSSLSVTIPDIHESSDETIRPHDDSSSVAPTSSTHGKFSVGSINAHPGVSGGANNQMPSSIDGIKPGSPPHKARPGTVVTSSRQSKRRLARRQRHFLRCSNLAAAQAFAVATAGSAHRDGVIRGPLSMVDSRGKRFSVINAATAMRVLNILRQWLMRFPEDFERNEAFRQDSISLAEDLVVSQVLVMAENRAAARVLKQLKAIMQADPGPDAAERLMIPSDTPSLETFDSLSAIDVAEQMTYLDHQLFRSIKRQEFHSLAWMKEDKNAKAKHILLVSKRFNELSRLVVSEIVSRNQIVDRVACIEKWIAVGDMCRFMHNYNGALQICAALVNSAVFRLKRTWEKVSKTTKQTLDKLQNLVSSDGRFKNLREALHSCDPPCIPYLGMYLTDLSFIEEGSPDFTDDRLVNYCKMRMVSHVIQEIQQFQQHTYRIEPNQKVIEYLLDTNRMLSESAAYSQSLLIEPRQVLCTANE